VFPGSSQQDQTTITVSMSEPNYINSFINHQHLGGSPIMAPPVSVFPAPTTIRHALHSIFFCLTSDTEPLYFYSWLELLYVHLQIFFKTTSPSVDNLLCRFSISLPRHSSWKGNQISFNMCYITVQAIHWLSIQSKK